MTALRPDKLWWTASEIARARLPDMPGTRQNIEAHAKRNGWREHPILCRERVGRGGGWEYSWELFPMRARRALLKAVAVVADVPAGPARPDRGALHAYYEGLPEQVKERTRRRHRALLSVMEMERTGLTRFLAVDQVARAEGVSARTLWNWLRLVEGADRSDWLYHLAPRHRAAARPDNKAACSPAFMARLKALYLRLEGPTFAQCYRDAARIAEANGWVVPPERTARRHLEAQVPRVVRVYAREGEHGLARCFPPLVRDKTQLHAMEAVNADCHKFDVFVRWPGREAPSRPQIVAFQDIHSGKILSWRLDHTPNEVAVMSAFGEMVEAFGIPAHCTFDNGREFAAKWLSGGARTRYRGKIRDDDPLGVLPLLGIRIHWAMPGHGQAKPIERAFRDFAGDIAKDVRFAGAYVGHRPDAKPENYGAAAIPVETFVRVVGERVAEHNARLGRRSDTALGGSFDEAFARSYAHSAIRRATDEQRRLWLMGQKTVTLQRGHGRAHLFGNYYWSDWMTELAGRKVVARFDVEDLHAGAYVYELSGEFLGFAPCQVATGFYDLTAAKDNARRKAAFRRAQKRLLEKERAIDPGRVAAELDGLDALEPVRAEAKIVALPRGDARPEAARVTRPVHQDDPTPEDAAKVLAFQERFYAERAREAARRDEEQPIERFRRALEMERRIAAGRRVGAREMRWLKDYQTSPEYRGHCRMYEDFGDAMFLN